MRDLTIDGFSRLLSDILDQREPQSALQEFVFARHQADDEVEVEPTLEEILPIIEPYAEYQEAFGDESVIDRLRRLRTVLTSSTTSLRERAVFALEYETIIDLVAKLDGGQIDRSTFDGLLAKLSPASFDLRRIALWGRAHLNAMELDVSRMT